MPTVLRFSKIFRYHQLKLYPEEESGPQSTKKPVVVETYDEIVFSDPSEAFVARIQNHPIAIVPRLPTGLVLPPGISPYFTIPFTFIFSCRYLVGHSLDHCRPH